MKLLSILYLNFFILSNPIYSEIISNKYEILQKSRECLRNSQQDVCIKLVFQLERLQFTQFELNRFKCQTSILGLQTELVQSHFFVNIPKRGNGIMIPYVIKNC